MTQVQDEAAYHAANAARIKAGLRPFNGIDEFLNGFDQGAIARKRAEIDAHRKTIQAVQQDPGRAIELSGLERGESALLRQLHDLGGALE